MSDKAPFCIVCNKHAESWVSWHDHQRRRIVIVAWCHGAEFQIKVVSKDIAHSVGAEASFKFGVMPK